MYKLPSREPHTIKVALYLVPGVMVGTFAISLGPHAAWQGRMSAPIWRKQNQCPKRVAHVRGR